MLLFLCTALSLVPVEVKDRRARIQSLHRENTVHRLTYDIEELAAVAEFKLEIVLARSLKGSVKLHYTRVSELLHDLCFLLYDQRRRRRGRRQSQYTCIRISIHVHQATQVRWPLVSSYRLSSEHTCACPVVKVRERLDPSLRSQRLPKTYLNCCNELNFGKATCPQCFPDVEPREVLLFGSGCHRI